MLYLYLNTIFTAPADMNTRPFKLKSYFQTIPMMFTLTQKTFKIFRLS